MSIVITDTCSCECVCFTPAASGYNMCHYCNYGWCDDRD